MAMTVPIVIPSTPSTGNSPASEGGDLPRTPISPNMQATSADQTQQQSQAHQQASNGTAATPPKRKPSRRANTAERRATHNAVERQRRETLNGRFLDLAALLPNLSQIRRPSKSSIVNSSIAHIHASRRHRLNAARELRLVKLEADALRRELNEWRDRAGIPRVEEPIRGEGFAMVLSGELEPISSIPGEEEEDEAGQYGGYPGDDDDEYMGNGPQQMIPSPMADNLEDHHRLAMLKSAAAAANANPFAHSMPAPPASAASVHENGVHLSHMLSRSAQPFDGPAMGGLYDQPGQFPSQFMHNGPHHSAHASVDPEKLAAWNLYNQQQQILQAQRSLFTPPATSHGLPASNGIGNNATGSPPGSSPGGVPSGNPFNDPASQAFLVNLQRQQMMQQQHGNNNGHNFNGSDRDDASSVGSVPRGGVPIGGGGRARSGSVLSAGSGSGYTGSPPHGGHGGASPVGSYELGAGGSSGPAEQYSATRRTTGWGGRDVLDMGVHHGHHGHHAHSAMGPGMLPSPISAGGHGGGGGGFAMMM